MRLTRTILADDHTLVRQGIRALFDDTHVLVVAEACNGQQLVDLVKEHVPDLVLVDVSMPRLNGIEAARRVKQLTPETKVIFLSMYHDKRYVTQAKEVGAEGYVLKDQASQQLLSSIKAVMAGDVYYPDTVNEVDVASKHQQGLTPREREVLQLVAEGKKNKEIAEILTRSVHTIRNHRAHIMRKLNIHATAEVVKVANDMGLIRLDTPTDSL